MKSASESNCTPQLISVGFILANNKFVKKHHMTSYVRDLIGKGGKKKSYYNTIVFNVLDDRYFFVYF